MELEPGQPFTIWRKLEDPNDSTTYYVKADVRDMRSNELIQSVNLTDQTGRIFSKQIDAPGDASSQGRWIAISTRVYTDSGYSTLSPIHKEESREYKIIRRLTSLGGGGSVSIDYKKIEKMFEDFKEELPEPQKISFSGLEKLIKEGFSKLEAKEMPTTDLSPVLEAIRGQDDEGGSLLDAIKNIPAPEKPDFSPILSAIAEVKGSITGVDEASKKMSDLMDKLKEFITGFADNIQESVDTGVKTLGEKAEAISNLTFTVKPLLPTKTPKEKEEMPHLGRAKNLL